MSTRPAKLLTMDSQDESYRSLQKFIITHRQEIEQLIGHGIRANVKRKILESYLKLWEKKNKCRENKENIKRIIGNGESWIVGKLIGKGHYGKVYQGIHEKSRMPVAIKISRGKGIVRAKDQAKIMKKLQRPFPRIYYAHVITLPWYNHEACFVLVMELLGESLKHRIVKKLKLPPLSKMASQMIDQLKILHSQDILHRDQKPQNWIFGIKKNSEDIHLIDFGLSQQVQPYSTNAKYAGSARYSSENALLKIEQSYRDDLLSLGYVLAEIYTRLPWGRGWRKIEKEALDLSLEPPIGKMRKSMGEEKKYVDMETFCSKLPTGLCKFIKRAKRMEFGEVPNYERLKEYFNEK